MIPDVHDLAQLSDVELVDTLEKLVQHQRYNKLDFYKPYPKQREFYTMGGTIQERMLFAGNQQGKSYAGGGEAAMHLTGLYPDWWDGRRWDRPTSGWACSESTTFSRDVAQTILCGAAGNDDALGTGFIPKHCFAQRPSLARGAVSDAFDTLWVKHFTRGVEDGVSTLGFKSYEQGRKKFGGKTLDFVWWDEEPAMDIYVEGNARWSATGGMSFMTFTPLLGYSEVVKLFLHASAEDKRRRDWVRMGFKDSLHMTEAMVKDLLAKYPAYQHAARMSGEPLLGEGAIFIIDWRLVTFPVNMRIPDHLAKIWGIDFGITHPFAGVLLAWDREDDIIYVLCGYRAANEIPIVHAEALRRIAADVPVAWPHDGHNRDKGSGIELAAQYKPYLKMLSTHATFPTGGYSTEAAVTEVDERLHKAGGPGGMLIREDFEDMFSEMRMYHRKAGLIVKEGDDLISGLYKGVMMKRFARPGPLGYRPKLSPDEIRAQRAPRTAPLINPFTGAPLTRQLY